MGTAKTTIIPSAPALKEPKTKKGNNSMKNFKETFKTIVITVLLTAIVAFICGVSYESTQTKTLQGLAISMVNNLKTTQSSPQSK